MRRSAAIILAILTLAAASAPPAFAAQRVEGLNAHEYNLLDLSKALGALHHLRGLCYDRERRLWQDRMDELVRLEQPSRRQVRAMTAKFREGFEAARRRFSQCSRSVQVEARLQAEQAIRVSSRIIASYRN